MPLKITNDVLFRYIFSKPGNQDLLLALVNSILMDAGSPPVASLEIMNPFNLRSAVWLKDSVLDLRARDDQGALYDVEVQLWDEGDYSERSLYYWAQTFVHQLEQGNPYDCLVPVICINLMGFPVFKNASRRHTCFMLRESHDPCFVLSGHLVIHFVEMDKPDHDGLDSWMALFGILEEGHRMSKEDKILIDSNTVFGRLKNEFDRSLEDREARELALAREKFQRDQISRESRFRKWAINLNQMQADIQQKEINIHQKEVSIQQMEDNLHQKEAGIQQKEVNIQQMEDNLHQKEADIKQKEMSIQQKEVIIHQMESKLQQKTTKDLQDAKLEVARALLELGVDRDTVLKATGLSHDQLDTV